MSAKEFSARLADLESHATLLVEACSRYRGNFNFNEIKNIEVRLRVLAGSGKGSGLLFELAAESNEKFEICALNQYGILKITEIERGTEKIIQEVEKKSLMTQFPGMRLPIAFDPDSVQPLYKVIELKDWIENGFLLDWEVPVQGASPKISTFTPQQLINRYAGQEAAHSDSTHGSFGQSVETLTMQISTPTGDICMVPVVYEYLYQIGMTVGQISHRFVSKYKPIS